MPWSSEFALGVDNVLHRDLVRHGPLVSVVCVPLPQGLGARACPACSTAKAGGTRCAVHGSGHEACLETSRGHVIQFAPQAARGAIRPRSTRHSPRRPRADGREGERRGDGRKETGDGRGSGAPCRAVLLFSSTTRAWPKSLPLRYALHTCGRPGSRRRRRSTATYLKSDGPIIRTNAVTRGRSTLWGEAH